MRVVADGSVPSGVALERTTLAWVRTSLAFVAVCLLLFRLAAARDSAAAEVAAWFGMVVAAGLGVWQRARHDARTRQAAQGRSPQSPGTVLGAAGGVLALAVAGLWLTFG